MENLDIFDKFDAELDTEGMQKDINDAAEGTLNRKEVPVGEYEVKIHKMELKTSKAGDPMFSCWFKVLSNGEYKGSMIFMNQLVLEGFQIHIVNEFLRSLDSGLEVEFTKYKNYAQLIQNIFDTINGDKEYGLKYSKNNKGYNTFEITQILEAQNGEKEELPFG